MRDFPPPLAPLGAGAIEVYEGDNLEILRTFESESFDLIYTDLPRRRP